jgi:large subunit ribosomal protein L2
MPVKKFNPVTPGTRTRLANTFEAVTTDKPEKSLLAPMSKTGGRNRTGKNDRAPAWWWAQAPLPYH